MDRPKTLVSHLEELRRRLLTVIFVFISVTGILVCLPSPFDSFSARMFKALYNYFIPALQATGYQFLSGPIFTDPLEPVMVNIKLASFVGGLFTVPVLVWQLFAFVAPAMKDKKGRFVLAWILFGSIIFFAAGLALSFFLLIPLSFNILLKYGISMGLVPMLTAGKFFSLTFWMLLLFSLPFELPLVMWFFSYLKIISVEKMKKARKVMWVGISIFSAVVTPDPTPFSMLILTVCLILLYELGIMVTVLLSKGKRQKAKRRGKN